MRRQGCRHGSDRFCDQTVPHAVGDDMYGLSDEVSLTRLRNCANRGRDHVTLVSSMVYFGSEPSEGQLNSAGRPSKFKSYAICAVRADGVVETDVVSVNEQQHLLFRTPYLACLSHAWQTLSVTQVRLSSTSTCFSGSGRNCSFHSRGLSSFPIR